MDHEHFQHFDRAIMQLVSLDRNFYTGLETILRENTAVFSERWLQVSDTLDKSKTLKILCDVLKAIGLTYSDFIRLILPEPAAGILVWRFLWHYVCNASLNTTLERQFWGECEHGVLSRVRAALVDEIGDRLFDNTTHNAISKRQKGHLISLLSSCLNTFIECAMLYTFIKRYNASVSEKLKSLVPLLELSLNGGGILYASSKLYWTVVVEGKKMTQEEIQMLHGDPSLRWAVLEIKLPVWREADYPKKVVDIENKEPDFIQISVIRDGVYVPEPVWRHPEKLDARDIFHERNVEVRRIMMDVIGNEKFLKQTGAVVIDRQGTLLLYRIEMPVRGIMSFMHMVRCVCPSTGREYLLHVPPRITDARQAVAWTFGETKDAYKPEIET